MADEIGTSFSAATLPTDILKPHGGVFVTYEHIVWIAITISIAAVAGFIAWRMLRNHREWREMKESMRAVRAEADRASYQYAKIEKDYERLKRDELRLKGGAEISKVLGTLGYDRGEIMDMLGVRLKTSEDPSAGLQPGSSGSSAIESLQDTSGPKKPLKQATEDRPSAKPSGSSGSSGRSSVDATTEGSLKTTAEDPLKTWASGALVFREGAGMQAKPLYEIYVVWCKANGIQPVTISVFGTQMPLIGYHKARDSKNGYVVYQNIALKHHNLKVVR